MQKERKRKEMLTHFVMPESDTECPRKNDHILKKFIVKIKKLQECSHHHMKEKP
jgi:hypothetical protein